MEAETFSNTLPEFTGEIENSALLGSLSFLEDLLGHDYKLLEWATNRVAVPLSIDVELPPLGNHKDIDIQSKEPIVIVFDVIDYPATAPMVYTDRLDFPKNKLAHLYIATKGRPPAFCYIRGSNDEWYANKRISDLLVRIGNWLRDAATGELTVDGDQFDPLRMEGYSGTNTYDYDKLAEVVHKNTAFIPGSSMAIALFDLAKDETAGSFILIELITAGNLNKVIEAYNKEKEKTNDDKNKRFYRFGFILWSANNEAIDDYDIDLPTNWEEFKAYCEHFGISYDALEEIIADQGTNHYIVFPVILAIKRPQNLIGFSSNIEFINLKFSVGLFDSADNKIINNIPISFQAHNQPLTISKAKAVSGSTIDISGRAVIFGCGALGSKVSLHLGRSGQTALTLIDPDYLSPHNLVRHALGGEYIGSNKAFAVGEAIKKLFPHETLSVISGPSFKDGLFEKQDTFDRYNWVFDFTASPSFFNKLMLSQSFHKPRLFSAYISDFGNLGVVLKEGKDRNPRIDDLQATLYAASASDRRISSWLSREQQASTSNNLVVTVGVGCNSETTVIADETVSAHAAFVAATLKQEMAGENAENGKIKLHRVLNTGEYAIETDTISVKPFDVLAAINDRTWSIRFSSGILNNIKQKSAKAKGKETGGIFVGLINHKTKTIHVTGIIDAPPDSKANAVCFYRGHQGLPKKIKEITDKSGGQVGYVGEWHSHPMGPNSLSEIDMASVHRFKNEFSQLITPLPVFLTIVAHAGILPYIFN